MTANLSDLLYRGHATLVTADIADYRHALHPAERDLLSSAGEKRAHEFSTGRFCAHQALHVLGVNDEPVLRGPQREPIWPSQIVGSISHCRDLAGAVVADKQRVKSVGLDIETHKQLKPEIARHICTDQEKSWLAMQDTAQQNLALLLIFSIKEAVFKCVYQATGEHLRFQQCEVVPGFPKGSANVTISLPGIALQPGEFVVRFYVTETHVYSGVLWGYLPAA